MTASVPSKSAPKLEVRWNTEPDGLRNGSVDYRVAILSDADEELAARTVTHKDKAPQRAIFLIEDFDELDDDARFVAFIRVTPVASTPAIADQSEEFILEFGQAVGRPSSTSGEIVRALVLGGIQIADREEFDILARDAHLKATEDKKGFRGLAHSSRKERTCTAWPDLLKKVEEDWCGRDGAVGRWKLRIRADGSLSSAVEFLPIVRGSCLEEAWARTTAASRRLATELVQGPGFVARVQSQRWNAANEYLLAWADAFDTGAPELALHGTIEVQGTLGGQTIGLIVLPLQTHSALLGTRRMIFWRVIHDTNSVLSR